MFLRIPLRKVEGRIDSRHKPLAAERHEEYGCKDYDNPRQDFQFPFRIHNHILNAEYLFYLLFGRNVSFDFDLPIDHNGRSSHNAGI